MEACNTKELRDNLKSFLDKVSEEGTVRINRNAETFIIMKSDEYMKMKDQIIELQESVISLLGTVGKVVDDLPSPKVTKTGKR
jgi:PHD/YefM family antitoxin component YafN of YafNO toxin-antitoxin module